MRYEMLLWDFDGTLADTLGMSVRLYNELAGRHGFRPIDDPQAVRRLSTLAFLRAHGISLARLPAFRREFLARQRAVIHAIRLFPDLPETLRAIHGRGVRLGVLSSNDRDNILACLDGSGVANLFDFVVGYVRLLGKARALRRVLKDRGLGAAELLYVGDEVRDVEAARRAGVDVAAVTWGYHERDVLAGVSPTHLVTRPGDILALLG
jgi:phosphoglycolate phosphatase